MKSGKRLTSADITSSPQAAKIRSGELPAGLESNLAIRSAILARRRGLSLMFSPGCLFCFATSLGGAEKLRAGLSPFLCAFAPTAAVCVLVAFRRFFPILLPPRCLSCASCSPESMGVSSMSAACTVAGCPGSATCDVLGVSASLSPRCSIMLRRRFSPPTALTNHAASSPENVSPLGLPFGPPDSPLLPGLHCMTPGGARLPVGSTPCKAAEASTLSASKRLLLCSRRGRASSSDCANRAVYDS
mmetsp:Transcript_123532/g.357200  ORF Transcript_123532/g.357200 Transcript_123532/m.357200 type:complete len:245 (-) Transcript_123532:91-825(-)